MENEFKSIADRVKEARIKKNLCQDYVAKSLGISQKAYSKIENNETRLSVDTLVSISRILEIPVVEFFTDNHSNVLNDFSNRSGGDNVIFKTESDKEKDELYQKLIDAKDEIIQSKEREIQTLLSLIQQRPKP